MQPPDRQPNSAPRRRFQANLEIARRPPRHYDQRNSAQVANCHLSLRDKAIISACAKIGARVIVVKRRTSFGIGELLALRARAMAALRGHSKAAAGSMRWPRLSEQFFRMDK
jgi:hypothetical protein